ncbi:MAG: queuosine precursor transporter [Eubacteriales bacterium]|nr:queuosine precursor transporter [Eubacteriales bacterium]MDY3333247.1 queuosine precursor transporter [Gallibacter sp.]
MNEALLLGSVFIFYSLVLVFMKLFGLHGLYVWIVVATIAANIEVLILVDAFGIEQTLGNVLFASTFLVTDIISENYGKKEANKGVNIGIAASALFILISQIWLLFEPSKNDWAMESIKTIFTNTPRIMAASLLVYAISQKLDVWLYHKWWAFTEKKYGNKNKYLWLRNNGSTLFSQFINIVMFNIAAFAGVYDVSTVINIVVAGYIIYIVTSLLDTPFVYLSRRIKPADK